MGEDLYTDNASMGTTLGSHSLTLLGLELSARRMMSSKEPKKRRHGNRPGALAWWSAGSGVIRSVSAAERNTKQHIHFRI